MSLTYGRQVANARTKSKALSVECYLMMPTKDEIFGKESKSPSKSPLFMHSGMSRFYFTVIDTMQIINGHSATISANVPAEDIDIALLRTESLVQMEMAEERNAAKVISNDKTGLAYTVPIAGKFGKRSAASILLDDSSQREELLKQVKWLEENLTKYKGNQKQIDAINEAVKLFDEDKLTGSGIKSMQKDIYVSEYKYFPSRKDENGNTVCFKIQVTYHSGSDTPVNVRIENFLAPLVKSKIGTKVIQLSKATNRLVGTMDLTLEKWYQIIKRMENTKNNFETINFPKMWKVMEDNSWKPGKIS